MSNAGDKESLRTHGGLKPVPWRVHLTDAWELGTTTAEDAVASFQAHRLHDGELTGKLAFAILLRSVMTKPRDVADLYLETLEAYGLRVEKDDFVEEPAAPAPFDRAWSLESPVSRKDALPGEVRCRVLRHDRVWVVAGVLFPRREDDAPAWEDSRMILDLVTSNLRIKA